MVGRATLKGVPIESAKAEAVATLSNAGDGTTAKGDPKSISYITYMHSLYSPAKGDPKRTGMGIPFAG